MARRNRRAEAFHGRPRQSAFRRGLSAAKSNCRPATTPSSARGLSAEAWRRAFQKGMTSAAGLYTSTAKIEVETGGARGARRYFEFFFRPVFLKFQHGHASKNPLA